MHFSPKWWRTHAVALFNILMIDLTLAGDNAIVVGMAASKVRPDMRAKVIFWGIAGAVMLRIMFLERRPAMLQVIGLTLAGGLLLLFVCWKMYRQIVDGEEHSIETIEANLASGKDDRHRDRILGGAVDHHPRRPFDVARQRAGGRGRGG